MQLDTALEAIRTEARACEYALPEVDGGTFDPEHLDVELSSQATLTYVSNAASCDAATGGWYYDVDPDTVTPTRIILCPTSCAAVRAPGGPSVQLRTGCPSDAGAASN
ncbi:hypothetical protein AKJ09_02269 [Labilithrix luteola]|uniref:Uncharacterized protein n=1 Tax=Labilithrix luteola TaxID=1391654 RepID=A0A0K1PPY6_9BACT|nr:hypothetical protein [Labilithrix luteola]AKU95605.1 hypothetical protein AKJ09_02269 [Labilithrix luteola]